MKTPTIKHKLWGKLKKEAHDSYKIVPVKDSMFYYIAVKGEELSSHYTLEEAIERTEYLRMLKFQELCYQALYERRKKKVKDL